MRILMTGAHGFIGRHMVKELVGTGHSVVGVDSLAGDIRNPDVMRRFLSEAWYDVVLHLAARTGRLIGEEDHHTTVTTNTLGTVNVAAACGEQGVRLCYVSTSEAFGDHGDEWVPDNGIDLLPHNLYGLSKRWGEEAAQLYAPNGLQILRPTMPYGPGNPAGSKYNALVTFLWCAHNRKPINLHEGAARCWCWIGDLTSAIRLIIENKGTGHWTVGRDDNETTMLEVAREACRIAEAPLELITVRVAPKAQTLVKRLKVNRLLSLRWRPTVDLPEGMERTYRAVVDYDANGLPPKGWMP